MNHINRFFSKRVIVIITGVVFILFMILVLPYMAEQLLDATNSSSSPDTLMSFNISDFYDMVESYGSHGRRVYIIQRWTFDVVWPLVYGCFLFSAISYLVEKNNKYRRQIILIPIIAVLFDLIENTFASIIMGIYPKQFDVMFYFLRIASTIKWVLIVVAFLLVIALLVQKIKKSFS